MERTGKKTDWIFRGDRLREIRENKGLKQRDLAELCGVTEFQISRYETGKTEPGPSVLVAMARSLNVSIDYLAGLIDHPHGYNSAPLSADEKILLEAYAAGDGATIMELVSARMRQVAETNKSQGG